MILFVLVYLLEILVVLVDGKGETAQELITHFLPALIDEHPHLDPGQLIIIRPFFAYGVKINPLSSVPGLSRQVQAHLVCQLVARLAGEDFKPRMLAILSMLCQAAIAAKGTLLDILRLLREPSYASVFAGRVADPELHHYLLSPGMRIRGRAVKSAGRHQIGEDVALMG